MGTTATIVLLVLIVLAVGAAVASSRRKRQRAALKERFGPEYDRAVESDGGQRAAERRLKEVADQRDKLEIRALDPAERQRYSTEWTEVQAGFVDAPDEAVFRADRLVGKVMRDRGYPVDDFDSKIDMVAVDHPRIASDYRAAHEIAVRRKAGEAGTTEDLRQAFMHYRSLFGELLGDGHQGGSGQIDVADRHDEAVDRHDAADRRDAEAVGDRRTDGRDGEPSAEGRHLATDRSHVAADGPAGDGQRQVPQDGQRQVQQDDGDRAAGETALRNGNGNGNGNGYVEGAPIDPTERDRTRPEGDQG